MLSSKILKNGLIRKGDIKEHRKASERYIEAVFCYPEYDHELCVWVPIEYRRTAVFAETEEQIDEVLLNTYEYMHPDKAKEWHQDQKSFWGSKRAHVTESFFDALKDCTWKCVKCDLPDNPNWARRVQDLKEYGYTMATDTNRYCSQCESNGTHILMLRVPLGGGELGYEQISSVLKDRILKTLEYYDVYEAKTKRKKSLIADHKFPEIRWDDETKETGLDSISEHRIKEKFQLLNNQRNLQKREVCRRCYQTNTRGYPYGIKFYYDGNEEWPENVPKRGKEARKGCLGCGWYDLETWRQALNNLIENHN